MKSEADELSRLIMGTRAAYALGANGIAWARSNGTRIDNALASTLIAYDLHVGMIVRTGNARETLVA